MQFMRLAGSASGSSLGINISTSSVTVIELAKFENTLSLQAFCRLPFPAESPFAQAPDATSTRARCWQTPFGYRLPAAVAQCRRSVGGASPSISICRKS